MDEKKQDVPCKRLKELNVYTGITMTPILVLFILSISSCFGYIYNEDRSLRYCKVTWKVIGEDILNSSVVLKKISGSSPVSCYMSCDVTDDCGAAAFRQPDECLLINKTSLPLYTDNILSERNTSSDLKITKVNVQ